MQRPTCMCMLSGVCVACCLLHAVCCTLHRCMFHCRGAYCLVGLGTSAAGSDDGLNRLRSPAVVGAVRTRAARSMQHATDSTHCATYSRQHTPYNRRHATCKVQHARCSTHPSRSSCIVHRAACNMHQAACSGDMMEGGSDGGWDGTWQSLAAAAWRCWSV